MISCIIQNYIIRALGKFEALVNKVVSTALLVCEEGLNDTRDHTIEFLSNM